jgi:glycosyltransferase involved in cell wall biosynthesis
MRGNERWPTQRIEENGGPSLLRYEQQGAYWRAQPLGGLATIDDMLPLFDDDRTFAVSLQSHCRGWKSMLFPTSPFRKLQAGEATRVLAPLSENILVSRTKLAALGAPDRGLSTTAWLLLFWKAAAAGWRSYVVGWDGPVSVEPDFPVHETAFLLQVLADKSLRVLGPCEPELSRGNIAFEPRRVVSRNEGSHRLRVLIISPFLPYPLSHGGAVRIFNLCRALSDRVDFGLIAIRESNEAIDYSKLHEIFSNIWTVDLDEPESLRRNSRRQDLPLQVRRHESASLRALVADVSQNWKPDLLQIEYTHLASLRESAMGVPALLAEHDLTLGLYRQFAEYERSAATQRDYGRWLVFEQEQLHAYEGVWTVSDEERDQAVQCGERPSGYTFTIPNGVDTMRFQPFESALSRPEVLFVGSFRHWPNILAFEKLCEEIMPRVWAALPDTLLHVVAGPNYERFQRMLRPGAARQKSARVKIQGFVEDLRPHYARAALVVAPLAISSGTNIKVLEAMACGKALVSTPIGCTGLGLRDGHDVLIRKDWGEFARAVCDLLRDELLRAQIGGNARRTAEERFSWNDIADLAFESYLAVLGRGESVDSEVREREYR